jgi:acetylornithine deacetylase/succinyl-diaminopimelate desuccinylase-like protein
VALKALARQGWRPRGTLVYLACADEEAGGMLGAGHVCKRHWDSLRADYLLTENGGLVSSHGGELNVTVHVGEKGVAWRRLRVTGTPGHGSMPYGADNALVKAAHVVSRLADYRPAPYVDDLWQTFVGSLGVDPALKDALCDPSRVDEAIAKLPAGVAKFAWSTTHTTFSPNMCRAGVKTNVIPDVVDIEVDIRTIPGDNEDEVRRHIDKALGDLSEEVKVEKPSKRGSASPGTRSGTCWDAWRRHHPAQAPAARSWVHRCFTRERGAVAYASASQRTHAEAINGRFHGNDSASTESLAHQSGLA